MSAPLKSCKLVSVVIPCYRSEQSIRILVRQLVSTLETAGYAAQIILVDDASPDNTWDVLLKLREEFGPKVVLAQLLTNSGQHNAILCGLYLAKGEHILTMDDDLQNPPSEVVNLLKELENGYDLAIASYSSKKHSAARNMGGKLIDGILRSIYQLPSNFQLTSFRAARASVIQSCLATSHSFPYVTAMLLAHSSRRINVLTRHDPRPFGSSNYNLKKNFLLALNLIFHYSNYPLWAVSIMCMGVFFLSAIAAILVLEQYVTGQITVPGWASTVIIVSFFNGVTMLGLVIFGFYLSRINQQISRSRVAYRIRELHE